MTAAMRSRISPNEPLPYSKIFEQAAQEAQQAELILARRLLLRAAWVLQDVATEARTAGEVDEITERLLRDINVALDDRPTLI